MGKGKCFLCGGARICTVALKLVSLILGGFSIASGIIGNVSSEHNEFNAYCRGDLQNGTSQFLKLNYTDSTETITDTYCDILWMEQSFVFGVGGIFLISLVMFFVTMFCNKCLNRNFCCKEIDFYFHFFGSIVLFVSGIFMAYSAFQIDIKICGGRRLPSDCQLFHEKIFAAGLAEINGIVFIAISLCVNNIRYKNYEEV